MKTTYLVMAVIGLGAGCANGVLEELGAPAKAGAAGQSGAEATAGAPAEVEDEAAWCDVAPIIEAKCARCHAEAPEHGAPFPLASYDDTQVLSRTGKARYEAMAAAVTADFMPATFVKLDPPVEPLSEAEKSLLLSWCAAGAPLGAACEAP